MPGNIVDTWIEEALQQGLQQGIQKEQDLVVRNLLEQGILTPEQIAAAIGMELSRVREIAQERSRRS